MTAWEAATQARQERHAAARAAGRWQPVPRNENRFLVRQVLVNFGGRKGVQVVPRLEDPGETARRRWIENREAAERRRR